MPEVIGRGRRGRGARRRSRASQRARGAPTAAATPIDVVLPVLHGPHGRGRRRAGHARARRRAVRGRRRPRLGGRHGQGGAEGAVRRRGPAGGAVRSRARARVARGRRGRRRARRRRSGYPVFTKPATLGSSVGISKVHDPGGAGRRPGRGVPVRAQGGGGTRHRARARDRVRGARQRRPGGVGRAARSCRRATSSTTTQSKYLDEHGAQLLIPADLTPTLHGAGPAHGGHGVPGDRVLGHGARRLLPARRRRAVGQRDQHDPGVHVDLDVSEALGGERAWPTPTWSSG